MPSSPRGVCRQSGQKNGHACTASHGPMWASAPTKNNVRFQRRGRCPHRPAGYVDRAVRKRTRLYRQPRADVGIGPYKYNVRFQRRGRCPHRPVGYVDRAGGKTDTPIPSAPGPMWASAPTKNNVRFQRRGRCPHRPVGYVDRAGGKDGHAHTVGTRADVGICPYKN